MKNQPTYSELNENGNLINTALEGTCQLWELNGNEWVVLCDNTVISREADEKSEDPIFNY